MSDDDTSAGGRERLVTPSCPRCDKPLRADEEWRLLDPQKRGRRVETVEDIQGDYAHEDCLTTLDKAYILFSEVYQDA